ncbi:MAG: hypothetical protein ABWY78_19560 [Microvirga sp.]
MLPCVLALGLLTTTADAAPPGPPVDTLEAMGRALWACWRPPEHVGRFQVTLTFALKRSGEVLGKPRITYSTFDGGPDERKVIVGAILQALDECTPVNVTEALGGAIAGRIFTMSFAPRTDRS